MSENYAQRFMKLCFGSNDDFFPSPYISVYMDLYSKKRSGHDASFFSISHVTNVINVESMFLLNEGRLLSVHSESTNYETEVKFDKYGFSFEPEELTIRYGIEGTGPSQKSPVDIIIPRAKWEPLNLLMEVTELPEGLLPEKTKQALIGEKIPLNVHSAYRKDGNIFLPFNDVFETLKKSGKEGSFESNSKKQSHIPFNVSCLELS